MLSVDLIRDIAEKYLDEYNVVGIRTQDVPFELGAIYHNSLVWIDGEMTGEELPGICATEILRSPDRLLSMHINGTYYGNYVAIICGNSYSWGQDDGEIIIEDPVVVEILK